MQWVIEFNQKQMAILQAKKNDDVINPVEKSYQLSLNTSNPDLTICFQRTVLAWVCPVLLVALTPFYLLQVSERRVTRRINDFNRLGRLRTIIWLIQFVTSVLLIFWVGRPTTSGDFYKTPADYTSSFLRVASMIGVIVLLRYDWMKAVRTSWLLCFFWLLAAISGLVQCRSNIMRKDMDEAAQTLTYFVMYNIYYAMVLLQLLLTFFVDTIESGEGEKEEEKEPLLGDSKNGKKKRGDVDVEEKLIVLPCPHDRVNYWMRLTFQWVFIDVIRGYRKPIMFCHLYALRVQDRAKTLLATFYKHYYIKEPATTASLTLTPGAQRKHAPLWKALLKCVRTDFSMGVALRAISIPLQFVNPQLLSMLIQFVDSKDPNTWKGLVIAALMLLSSFCFSILINNFLHKAFKAGLKARSLVNAVVYRKALRLSSSGRKLTTTGQVVNLMSVDAQKVQDMYVYVTLLWSVPLLLLLAIYFLWQTIGVSCLAGLGVLLFLIPLNAIYLAGKAFALQKDQMVQKDKRFRVMNEILSGMKVLKLYGWEPSFENKILGFRGLEMMTIKWANYINAFGSMCWLLTPYLVSLAIFGTYLMIDANNVLTAEKAFVTLSLINLLSWPLSILPLGVANTTQGIVSVRRVQAFLNLDELDDVGTQQDPTLTEDRIVINNATFSWGRDEPPTLHDISFKVPHRGLVAVVGAVGSGKSSLVNSILGEMFRKSGHISYKGTLALVPQQAWIVHNSLKENITFGKVVDNRKYKKVIRACALEQDLAMLPGGDETEIGEKGINLSGGQKQRVSLARAVYQDEDVYLLDDPLSAVDAHVGKHIFDHVIGPNGCLKNKTRLLVTHGITYLPQCDVIVVLKEGRVEEMGKYEELLQNDGAFADVIRSYLENEAADASDEETEAIREVMSHLSSADEKSDASCRRSRTGSSYLEDSGAALLRRRLSRSTSRKSRTDEDREAINQGVKLVEEEIESTGNISLSVVKTYMKAFGYIMMNVVVWSHLLYIVFQIVTNIWLSEWTNDQPVNTTYDKERSIFRLSIYGYLGIGQVGMALAEAFAVAHGCYSASLIMHRRLLNRIMHAPMSFFDTTPLGRIMNRFSKDLDVLDANMPLFVRQWLFAVSPVIVTITLICYSTPIFAAVFIPLAVVYIILQRLYVSSMRQWKRIDSVRRSPIYIHFNESVVGSSSIRAYRREQQFVDRCDRLIDESQRPWYMVIAGYRWCGIAMEGIGACIVFFSTLFVVLQRDTLSSSNAGLSVSYALQVTVYMGAVIRASSELESYVVSVERIDEYLQIASEAPWEIKEKKPPPAWPMVGTVQFSQYCTRYRPGLDLVLKNIDCFIKSGERIGIVGRTGAGKSSLSLALFRLIEATSGGIYIDGRQVSEMGLHALRSQVSIIPQDPVVFSGSLRSNLDPFNHYTDLAVWQALEHSHLKSFVIEVDEGLDYECGENGEALSVGQRQLLCLARALLRRSRILVLDEATAAVDFETDSLIQTTIREKFQHCTILTVAHRLYTVLDYDRIMVLDKGAIIEMDTPKALLSDRNSVFYGMSKDAGLI